MGREDQTTVVGRKRVRGTQTISVVVGGHNVENKCAMQQLRNTK